jgi:hypothetical protein
VVWQDAVRGCRPPATASIHSQMRAVRFEERRGSWVGLTKAGLPKRIGDKAKRALEWELASSRAFVTAYSRTRSRGGFRAFGAALRVNLTARGYTSPWRSNRGADGSWEDGRRTDYGNGWKGAGASLCGHLRQFDWSTLEFHSSTVAGYDRAVVVVLRVVAIPGRPFPNSPFPRSPVPGYA